MNKKIIKLTEYDLERIVKKVISEKYTNESIFDFTGTPTKLDEYQSLAKSLESILFKNKDLYYRANRSNVFDKDSETLQKALILLGYSLPRFGSDGKFGRETEKAIKSFEIKNGLEVDGIADSSVIKRMILSLRKKSSSNSQKPKPITKPEVSKNNTITKGSKNYIIGDSQTPFIDRNSIKASRISEKGGMSSLWEGGKGLSWLKSAVQSYPVSPNVNSIIINIGTNGGFNPKDDVSGLVSAIKEKFPNAKILAVQGSWGWGGNVNVTNEKVKKYYDKFRNLGVLVLSTAIGKVKDPHGNLPIYSEIGAEIDSVLS